MARIAPFRTVHYNGGSAGTLDRLITPPYDIISPQQQEAYYQAHERNIIRLVLGKHFPGDGPGHNRYTRAAATLREWLNQGVLVKNSRPSLTIYQMEFEEPEGGKRTIDGIVALVEVDDYGRGKVLPHEKTYRGPKQDQLDLLKACRAHLTPIHGIFNDKDDSVISAYSRFMKAAPDQEAEDRDGTVHRTWTFDDEPAVREIVRLIEDKSIFIADGHHRYETSLAFKKEMRRSQPTGSVEGADYVMMYLTSTSHPGLTILPAHRLVRGIAELDVEAFFKRLAPYFHIEQRSFDSGDSEAASRTLVSSVAAGSGCPGTFGVAVRNEQGFRLIRLRSLEEIDHLIDSRIPSAIRSLDVTILGEAVLGFGLGLDKDDPEGFIEYTASCAEALERIAKGEVQLAFIHNPTRVEQVQTAAELGHKLPHKSTYFFPKIASGLVLNVF